LIYCRFGNLQNSGDFLGGFSEHDQMQAFSLLRR
jgi:hypothetical protein